MVGEKGGRRREKFGPKGLREFMEWCQDWDREREREKKREG